MYDCNCTEQVKIRRGSTPTNSFVVDIDLREATVYAWYAQDDKLLFKKNSASGEVVVDESAVYVTLTQHETLMFSQKKKNEVIAIQLGYIFANGKGDRSEVIYTTVGEILDDEEMVYVPSQV